jgi:23S rRNA pseudouridine955/2504/2580 synthase
VNGKRVAENCQVFAGDKISLFLPNKKNKDVLVVFEDDNVLVAFKPQGMEVTKKDKVFLESECLEDVFEGAVACHRLDKNTEGLVVMTKNLVAEKAMLEAFKNHSIKKCYNAVAFGNVNPSGENFVDYLVKNNNSVKVFKNKTDGASQIKTNYEVKKLGNQFSLLSIEILTGKTHQIRAQLAFHQIYILGDERYGKKDVNAKFHTKKQMLCATELTFENLSKPLDYLNGKTIKVTPTFAQKFEELIKC